MLRLNLRLGLTVRHSVKMTEPDQIVPSLARKSAFGDHARRVKKAFLTKYANPLFPSTAQFGIVDVMAGHVMLMLDHIDR